MRAVATTACVHRMGRTAPQLTRLLSVSSLCTFSHSSPTPSFVASLHSPTALPCRRQLSHTTVQRDPRFATLTAADIAYFREVLGPQGVLTDSGDLAPLNTDWMKKWRGASQLALRPASTAEVSAVLKYCNERRLAVVPQGGNTGLVGGSIPLFDEIILSTSRLNRILSLDQYSGIVQCESGVVLDTLNTYLEGHGFIMPLDLGAKGSCQVGGNAATNAGGIRFLRYGSLHGTIVGMEMVLADGTVVDHLSTLRKDNTGYDLKQLFIGSEGTLGIITKLCIVTPRKPKSVNVAFVGVNSWQDVLATLVAARTDLQDILSAIEFVDRPSLELVLKHLDGTRDPLTQSFPFYVLVETHGSNSETDQAKLNGLLEQLMTAGAIQDGVVAQDELQQKRLWRIREGVTEALSRAGAVYKYDVSLPVKDMYGLVEHMRERLRGKAMTVGYGHLGDSNLHLNFSCPKPSDVVLDAIEPYVFEKLQEHGGSVSAEHGLGQAKAQFLHLSKKQPVIDLMRRFKTLLDPHGILNPYKVLP